MPTIAVNLGDVTSAFEDLPFGEYLGEVEKVAFLEAREQGKFPQLRVQYLVIDGDLLGRKQSQFLSMSPNAMGFVKQFFAKFGLGETENFDVDDDTLELTDPDITGYQVIFKVGPDKKDATRTRTELVSVESEVEAPAPAPKAKAAAPARPAARPAAPVAVEEEVEAEAEPEPEAEPTPAPAPRRVAPRPAARPAATATAPARRTLR
jgi:hypothetical protein